MKKTLINIKKNFKDEILEKRLMNNEKKRVKGFIFVQVLNLVLNVSIYFY